MLVNEMALLENPTHLNICRYWDKPARWLDQESEILLHSDSFCLQVKS